VRDFLGNALMFVLFLAVLEFLGIPALSGIAWLVFQVRDFFGYGASLVPELQGLINR